MNEVINCFVWRNFERDHVISFAIIAYISQRDEQTSRKIQFTIDISFQNNFNKIVVKQLTIAMQYNLHMTHVNRANQLRNEMTISRFKQVKWTKRVIEYMINSIKTNAYIVWSHHQSTKNLNHRNRRVFIQRLIDKLLRNSNIIYQSSKCIKSIERFMSDYHSLLWNLVILVRYMQLKHKKCANVKTLNSIDQFIQLNSDCNICEDCTFNILSQHSLMSSAHASILASSVWSFRASSLNDVDSSSLSDEFWNFFRTMSSEAFSVVYDEVIDYLKAMKRKMSIKYKFDESVVKQSFNYYESLANFMSITLSNIKINFISSIYS